MERTNFNTIDLPRSIDDVFYFTAENARLDSSGNRKCLKTIDNRIACWHGYENNYMVIRPNGKCVIQCFFLYFCPSTSHYFTWYSRPASWSHLWSEKAKPKQHECIAGYYPPPHYLWFSLLVYTKPCFCFFLNRIKLLITSKSPL